MSPKAQQTLIIVAALLLVLWYLRGDLSDAAATAKDATRRLGPTANDNWAYTGVNEVGEAVTGDENFSLGVWLWEMANPEKVEAGL